MASCSASELPAATVREESVKVAGIPELAYSLKRTLIGEVRFWWGIDTKTTVFFSQVHQESRWKPEAKSKYAAGLSQFTPSTAEWISRLYPKDLGEGNPLDPKWALRALVRYDKFLYDKFPGAITGNDRWAFVLSSYNSGLGWTIKERKSALIKGKNQNQWWCSVQHELVKAKWAFDESRDYVDKIIFRWIPLYEKARF